MSRIATKLLKTLKWIENKQVYFLLKSLLLSFYCVCVKRITLCNCLCSSSASSPSRFSASAIRNIGEFGAKGYFTDHQRVNTIHYFTDSVPVLKIYNCYQDAQTFEQLSISTQALTRREQCADVSNPLQINTSKYSYVLTQIVRQINYYITGKHSSQYLWRNKHNLIDFMNGLYLQCERKLKSWVEIMYFASLTKITSDE